MAVESPDLSFILKTGSVLAALISAQDLMHFSAAIFSIVIHRLWPSEISLYGRIWI